MALRIEDYALIGDGHTAALVGFDGSIDWLCFPRFDSASTFGALLGTEEHGHWTLRPVGATRATSRRYLDDTFVLVTRWTSDAGEVEVTDFMPIRDRRADIVRRITGIRGTVALEQVLRIRFDYADSIPWVRQVPDHDRPGPHGHAMVAVAGPDAIVIRGPKLTPQGLAHHGEFEVHEGEVIDIGFTWYPSHREPPPPIDVEEGLTRTIELSRSWASHFEELGEYDHVGSAIAARAAGPDARRHRRHRRRGDHEPARGARRRAQLGLPLRVAPRRRAHPAGAHGARPAERGSRMA